MRGVNIGIDITEEDFQVLKPMGVNLVRVFFPVEPFMQLEEPYSLINSSFNNLDRILDLYEKYKIKAVIDPHRFPGTWHKWTMINNDKFWTDFKLVRKSHCNLGTHCYSVQKIREYMKSAKEFTEKYKVPMFIGEFSCPRWTGDYGNQYLADQIEVYEEYGFSWAYHAFRENQLWDVEMNNYDKTDTIRVETTPRKELLIEAFSLNK